MAPEVECGTAGIASAGSTLGAQPEMLPSSVAKMNRLGPESAPDVTMKSAPLLNTMPVGALGGVPSSAGGTLTISEFLTPLPSYSVDSPVPLSATHTKPFGLKT